MNNLENKQASHEEIIQAIGQPQSLPSTAPKSSSLKIAAIITVVVTCVCIVSILAFIASGERSTSNANTNDAVSVTNDESSVPVTFATYIARQDFASAKTLIHNDSAIYPSIDLASTLNSYAGPNVEWGTCKEITLKEFRSGTYKKASRIRTSIYVPLSCQQSDGTQVELEFDLQKSDSGELRIFDIIARLP